MSLRGQAAGLTILHAADILQPLLILPYATRVLGAHQFGKFAYVMAIGQFAATFVDYGFHWTGQRAAGADRNAPAAIASLYAEVLLTKASLCLLVTVAGLLMADSVLGISRSMFLCTMLTAFGGVAFPIWLLIGLERAWQAALATVVARIFAFVSFIVLVTSPMNVAAAVASQSAVQLVAALVSLPFFAPIAMVGLRSVRLSHIPRRLKAGSAGFVYTFVERMSLTLPMLLVQHFGGYVAAGEYALAEKFVSGTRPFFRIMSETFLSRVAFYAHHDPEAGLRLIWRALSSAVVGLIFSLVLFTIAPMLIVPVFGASFAGAVPILRTLAIVPLLLNLSSCTSNLYMFNYGHERAWSALYASGLAVMIGLAILLNAIVSNASIAVAWAVVAKEAFVLLVSGAFLAVFLTRTRRRPSASGAVAGGRARTRATVLAVVHTIRSLSS